MIAMITTHIIERRIVIVMIIVIEMKMKAIFVITESAITTKIIINATMITTISTKNRIHRKIANLNRKSNNKNSSTNTT